MVNKVGSSREQVLKNIDGVIAEINKTPGITAEEMFETLTATGKITIGKSAMRRYLRTLCKRKAIMRVGVWEYRYYPGTVPLVLSENERWKENIKKEA
jgi:hypothetical protein